MLKQGAVLGGTWAPPGSGVPGVGGLLAGKGDSRPSSFLLGHTVSGLGTVCLACCNLAELQENHCHSDTFVTPPASAVEFSFRVHFCREEVLTGNAGDVGSPRRHLGPVCGRPALTLGRNLQGRTGIG